MSQPSRTDALTAESGLGAAPRPMPVWQRVVVFCLLAALIPETVATLSTPVLELLANPISLAIICLFYGTADLLVREALVRRRLGWLSAILLGVAFGAFNEGVVAGTWYSVHPQGYAFIGPVDLAWIVALTLFHTFISVVVPIALFEIIFPDLAGKPLLSRRGISISAALFFGFTFLIAQSPINHLARLIVLIVATALAAAAVWLVPAEAPHTPSIRTAPGLWWLRGAGFAASALYFAVIYVAPQLTLRVVGKQVALAQYMDIALMLALGAAVLWVGWRWIHTSDWAPRQTLAVISGALALPILLLSVTGLSVLEPLATVPFLGLLVWLELRFRRTEATA